MRIKLITGSVLIFFFVSCANNNSNPPAAKMDTVAMQTQSVKTADSIYAYIKDVKRKNDSVFINADEIQFLTGDAAVEAAKKNNEADTSYDDKGNITSISVDDDYYIVNDSKELRSFALSKDVMIETINMSAGVSSVNTTLDDFVKKHNKGTFPFILKIKNNQVIEIKEVYVP